MAREAKLVQTDSGVVPEGDGWFVLNARDARWSHSEDLGSYAPFEGEGDAQFGQLGINLSAIHPGQPSCMYHGEEGQEDFFVLSGECLLIVEPCILLSVGARGAEGLVYPVNETALKRGAGVEQETNTGKEAYARFERPEPGQFREGDLPASL